MSDLDLTPFGFTPTENSVYRALIELGPSGGYPLSNALGIARANTYQALKGLVGKEAAVLVQEKPAEYRAISPEALYAKIVNKQAQLLGDLEDQIAASSGASEPSITPIDTQRSFVQMVLRDAARATDNVTFVGESGVIQKLAPAWRKRVVDRHQSAIWCVGEWDGPDDLEITGRIEPDRLVTLIGHKAGLYHNGKTTMVFGLAEPGAGGYWTDEPLLSGLVAAAIRTIVED